jgi:hypothetical protein
MITIMIVFMNGWAGGGFLRVDECTNAFGWRSGLRLWTCMPWVYWDLGFRIRDDGVKTPVYILRVRIRYSISNTFDIGNPATSVIMINL